MADLPGDPGAISALADGLRAVSASMADVGLGTESLRGSVMGSQQWQGSASEKWYAVITDRIGDAGLTNDVLGSAAAMLSGLASDLEAERRTYDKLSGGLYSSQQVLGGPEPYTIPVLDPSVQRAMDACAARAAGLLEDAARKLVTYAVLAEDIHATPAANRTPGVADGANRQAASLQLLATLFGSVRGGQLSGSQFEQAVLQALGIPKNTQIWRPDPAFEGKLTASGLAKGTIADGWGNNFLLEIKGTSNLQARFQIRLQSRLARLTGNQLWIIKKGPGEADPEAVKLAEGANGGVLYTSDNGKTYTDGNGNPVKVSYDKGSAKIDVQGYVKQYPGEGDSGTGPVSSPDTDAPAAPESPSVSEAPPAAPVAPPEVPENPELPELPDIPDIPIP